MGLWLTWLFSVYSVVVCRLNRRDFNMAKPGTGRKGGEVARSTFVSIRATLSTMKRLIVNVPRETKDWLRDESEARNVSLSELIRRLIRKERLEQHGKETGNDKDRQQRNAAPG